MGSEFGQFDEYKAQAFDDSVRMLYLYDAIIVVEIFYVGSKYLVYQAERIYRLEEFVFFFAVKLPYISLGCIEQYPLHES